MNNNEELLRQCIASGQVSASQIEAHRQAGDLSDECSSGVTTKSPAAVKLEPLAVAYGQIPTDDNWISVPEALGDLEALGAGWAQELSVASAAKFKVGDLVTKIKGSQWKGRVVGTYSTTLTPEGYAVESSTECGSVQIYPAAALELVQEAQEPVLCKRKAFESWARRQPWIKDCGKAQDGDAYGHWDTQKAWLAWNAALAAPQQEAQEPALFVSPKQLAALTDPDDPEGEHGRYLPARKTSKGLFTQPLYTAPQPAPAPLSDDAKDAARWRMVALIGNEVMLHPEKRTQAAAVKAYMDATHSGLDLTGAVDAALAAQGGKDA